MSTADLMGEIRRLERERDSLRERAWLAESERDRLIGRCAQLEKHVDELQQMVFRNMGGSR